MQWLIYFAGREINHTDVLDDILRNFPIQFVGLDSEASFVLFFTACLIEDVAQMLIGIVFWIVRDVPNFSGKLSLMYLILLSIRYLMFEFGLWVKEHDRSGRQIHPHLLVSMRTNSFLILLLMMCYFMRMFKIHRHISWISWSLDVIFLMISS